MPGFKRPSSFLYASSLGQRGVHEGVVGLDFGLGVHEERPADGDAHVVEGDAEADVEAVEGGLVGAAGEEGLELEARGGLHAGVEGDGDPALVEAGLLRVG